MLPPQAPLVSCCAAGDLSAACTADRRLLLRSRRSWRRRSGTEYLGRMRATITAIAALGGGDDPTSSSSWTGATDSKKGADAWLVIFLTICSSSTTSSPLHQQLLLTQFTRAAGLQAPFLNPECPWADDGALRSIPPLPSPARRCPLRPRGPRCSTARPPLSPFGP